MTVIPSFHFADCLSLPSGFCLCLLLLSERRRRGSRVGGWMSGRVRRPQINSCQVPLSLPNRAHLARRGKQALALAMKERQTPFGVLCLPPPANHHSSHARAPTSSSSIHHNSWTATSLRANSGKIQREEEEEEGMGRGRAVVHVRVEWGGGEGRRGGGRRKVGLPGF